MKKPILKDFSVVGIYADNNQPWVEWVRASTPQEAALKGIKKTYKKGENGVEEADIFVVEVFKGHIRGQLPNDTTISVKDYEKAN
jgi:hypothetical protein